MKIRLTILLSAVILMTVPPLGAQSGCRVLMPSISDIYTGECRQGLADGYGEATGTDSYRGQFRRGLPDGEGIYTWASGATYRGRWKKGMRDGMGTYSFMVNGRDSVQAGIWKKDLFKGEERIAPYKITYNIGVPRSSFLKQATTEKYVTFKFYRAGASSFDIQGLLMQGSSGVETTTTAFTGFDNPSFPFEGKVQFKAPNLMNTATNNYELRFVINEPGGWQITIYY